MRMPLGQAIRVKKWIPKEKRIDTREMVLMERYRYFGLFVDQYGIRECFTWMQVRQIQQGATMEM